MKPTRIQLHPWKHQPPLPLQCKCTDGRKGCWVHFWQRLHVRIPLGRSRIMETADEGDSGDTAMSELRSELLEKERKLTDIRLEALSSAHQLEQLREAMNNMQVCLFVLSVHLSSVRRTSVKASICLYFSQPWRIWGQKTITWKQEVSPSCPAPVPPPPPPNLQAWPLCWGPRRGRWWACPSQNPSV